MLFLRALAAFLVLPGTVAFIVPAFILGEGARPAAGAAWGYGLWGLGFAVLIACIRQFYVSGKGTLAPWDPPRHLVTEGPYRWTRNPMYVGVLLMIGGLAWAYRSTPLAVYGFAVAVVFHVRVLTYEEPRLQASFGGQWQAYRQAVARWIPGVRPRGAAKG
jgi:protein-S-isoprenylcysteine O-methyltransferase Ste14